MDTIRNPILPGFHPDPSILRLGDDFYIATSTFEWWPGVALFHSKDLRHWQAIGHVITRRSQLDLLGIPDSGGTWAPSLSHDGQQFHLVVCNVATRTGPFKDMHVLLFTAEKITGPWSDPIDLGGSGFDPSLFHDDDGRKWLANIQWDYRPNKPRFAGLVIQEYDPKQKKLVGALTTILQKPVLLEGPNLYKKDGWYYLMCAEGGTGWNHGISMARSRKITGPYEVDPQPLILTTRKSPENPLQKAGHGEIVQTQAGEWYLVHLACRPVYPDRRSILSRETCLQKIAWSKDGWLRLEHGVSEGNAQPLLDIPAPKELSPHPWPLELSIPTQAAAPTPPLRDDFDSPSLSPHWQTLREPADDSWANLTARKSWLRLRGRESTASLFHQSLVARRIESFNCVFETRVDFNPTHFTQSAGLICYYDTRQNYYLSITHDEQLGRVLRIVLTDDGKYDELAATPFSINDWPAIHLRAAINREQLQFTASKNGENWQAIGPVFDMTKLSDDYGSTLRFSGPMIGLCCQDLNAAAALADFDYFQLQNL